MPRTFWRSLVENLDILPLISLRLFRRLQRRFERRIKAKLVLDARARLAQWVRYLATPAVYTTDSFTTSRQENIPFRQAPLRPSSRRRPPRERRSSRRPRAPVSNLGRHMARLLSYESLEHRQLLSVTPAPAFIDNFNQPAGSQPNQASWTQPGFTLNSTDPNNPNVTYTNSVSTLQVVNDPQASDGKALAMSLIPVPNSPGKFDSSEIIAAPGSAGANLEYGHIEARIKVPEGSGIWPAFWLIGSNWSQPVSAWPVCGEVDVMEISGNTPGVNQASLHGPITQASGPVSAYNNAFADLALPNNQSFYSTYHTFAIDWAQNSIAFSIDGTVYATYTPANIPANDAWVFNGHPFSIVLNVAEGTTGTEPFGPAASGSAPTGPETMYVDYVSATGLGQPPTIVTPAQAAPNPVVTTSTALSVLVAGTGLTYSWTATGTAPAPVTFSVNGTSTANYTTATFKAAGTYTLQATATGSNGLTATSSVTVVVSQTLTAISVSPSSTSIAANSTQQFTAVAEDQFGNPLANQPSVILSLAQGGGTITGNGLFTAPSTSGVSVVRATSGTVSGTASITVTAATTINHAPVIGSSPVILTPVNQGANAPAGSVGTSISSVVAQANITDADPNAKFGIAITAIDSSQGTWFYSVNNGATWATIGAASTNVSLLLAADGNTRVYFQPVPGYSGVNASSFMFRAWDQTTGTNGSTANTSINGGQSAFSPTTAQALITITAATIVVNQPPIIVTPAIASPNPVATTTSSLSVGAMGTNLTYAWSTIGSTPAGVSFSVNGTSTANYTTATFKAAGTYTLQATATGSNGLTATSSVTVVVSQTLTAISVSPSSTSIAANSTQQFTAVAEDQFGNPLANQPSVILSLAQGGGTITGNGLFTAPSTSGVSVVRATSGTVSGTASITVTAATTINHAPVIGSSPVILTPVNQGANAPAGSVGTSISSVVAQANITDADPNAKFGIAITAIDSSQGTWFYSVNNGATWATIGAASTNVSLLLAADGNTRVYFQPVPGYSGVNASSFMFRAWDQTTGTNGSTANTSINGGQSAFSPTTAQALITITAATPSNLAPVVGGPTVMLNSVNQGAAAPSGAVGTLVSSVVAQASITDGNPTAVLGIAVTAIDSSHGTWFYSINNGATWATIAAASATSSLLLAADGNTRIYFQPNPGFSGIDASSFMFRGWNQTTGSNGSTANTSTNGGTTAFSASTAQALITITA